MLEEKVLPVVELVATTVRDLSKAPDDPSAALVGLVERVTSLFGAEDAGILVLDARGAPQILVATSDDARVAEMLQLDANSGPCLEALIDGVTVTCGTAVEAAARWPDWVRNTEIEGYESFLGAPFTYDGRTVGTLNVFSDQRHAFDTLDARVAEHLAEIVTVVMLLGRQLADGEALARQLQKALDSRVVIEQAKGIYAERAGTTLDQAFEQLRRGARSSGRSLRVVAAEVVESRYRV